MVSNYVVGSPSYHEEDVFVRVVPLTAGIHSYSTLSLSMCKQYSLSSQTSKINTINEIYLFMTLEKLRELDGDSDAHERFIRENSVNLYGGMLNICFINLQLTKGQKLNKKDIEYINSFLMWSKNDIYVLPTLTFKDEALSPEDRRNTYNAFVSELLNAKNNTTPKSSNLRIGITIPAFYSRSRLEDIFNLFSNENRAPTFVAIDFENKRLSTSAIEQKITTTHRYYKEAKEEKYFIYGLRARGRKRGNVPTEAEDIGTLLSGMNAIGRIHQDKQIKFVPQPFSLDSFIGIDRTKYVYNHINQIKNNMTEFIGFLEANNIDYNTFPGKLIPDKHKRLLPHYRNFSRLEFNKELDTLASEVIKNETREIKIRLNNKETTSAKNIVTHINRIV